MINCSSLYFLSAGPSCETRFGDESVSALMSGPGQHGLPMPGRPKYTCNDVCELRKSQLCCRPAGTSVLTSPGGAPSTKAATVSRLEAILPQDFLVYALELTVFS